MSQWDSWALRATIGGRHGSRTGRLNTPSALSLVLPTDVPAGIFSPFSIHTSPKVPRWRESLAMALNEISNPPMKPNVAQTGPERSSGHSFTFATPALFRGKPSVHIAGSRIYLTHRHSAPQFMPLSFASASWVTANIYFSEDDDVSTRAERGPLGSFEPSGLPSLENLSGAFKNEIQGTFEAFKAINLDFLRGPSTPSPQHVLWAGADAVTGGGANSLASTEDHGWISPVTARESAQRSSLAVKSSLIAYLQRNSTQAGSAQCPLLLPFDLNARFVLNHPSRSGALPFTWALASTALESEIDSASLGL
jgi:hypothetical protein